MHAYFTARGLLPFYTTMLDRKQICLQKSRKAALREAGDSIFVIKFFKVCQKIAEYAPLQSRIITERNVQIYKVSMGIARYLWLSKKKSDFKP